MKKTLFVLLAFTLVLLLGCSNGSSASTGKKDKDDTTTDPNNNAQNKPFSKLAIGGYWYQICDYNKKADLYADSTKGYYWFTNYAGEKMYMQTDTELAIIHDFTIDQAQYEGILVYKKGDIIYRRSDNMKLMKIEFVNKWPYPNDGDYSIPDETRSRYDEFAAEDKLIIFSIFYPDGTVYDDGRHPKSWALVWLPI
jgi:hypothetical protein